MNKNPTVSRKTLKMTSSRSIKRPKIFRNENKDLEMSGQVRILLSHSLTHSTIIMDIVVSGRGGEGGKGASSDRPGVEKVLIGSVAVLISGIDPNNGFLLVTCTLFGVPLQPLRTGALYRTLSWTSKLVRSSK